MVMRVPPQVLTRILNDKAGSLEAVGKVSSLLCRSPPGEAHPVNFAGEFLESLLREGLRKIADVFSEQGDQSGALAGVEGFARESEGVGNKPIPARRGYDIPPTVAYPGSFLLLGIEALQQGEGGGGFAGHGDDRVLSELEFAGLCSDECRRHRHAFPLEGEVHCDVMPIELESPLPGGGGLSEDGKPVVLGSESGTALAVPEKAVIGKGDVADLAVALGAEDSCQQVTGFLHLLFVEIAEPDASLRSPGRDISPLGFFGAVVGKGRLAAQIRFQGFQKRPRRAGHGLGGVGFWFAWTVGGENLAGERRVVPHRGRSGKGGGKGKSAGDKRWYFHNGDSMRISRAGGKDASGRAVAQLIRAGEGQLGGDGALGQFEDVEARPKQARVGQGAELADEGKGFRAVWEAGEE